MSFGTEFATALPQSFVDHLTQVTLTSQVYVARKARLTSAAVEAWTSCIHSPSLRSWRLLRPLRFA